MSANSFPRKICGISFKRFYNLIYPIKKICQTYNPQLGITDVWDDINFYSEKRFHPTQKPQKLIERLILASSNEGDLVLDPFMGGGSTAVACVSTKRKYIGFEIDPEYYEKSMFRLSQMSLPL